MYLTDVPGASIPPPVDTCQKLFCRLGCVCSSLETAGSRKKILEHCSMPECMTGCVCGFLPGKPRSSRSFFSLLKGNESYYSKIDWSGERTRRERRVPERFSEFHLSKHSAAPSSPSSGEEQWHRPSHGRQRNGGRFSSPPKPNTASHRAAQQQQRNQLEKKKKSEPLRIKVGADEVKLLRWDSYVSLTRVYVAPDQEVFCIDHSRYACPCIEENRRVIRIWSKFVPPHVQTSTTKKAGPSSSSNKNGTAEAGTALRNVARKHTHPIMRTAHLKKGGTQAAALEENSKATIVETPVSASAAKTQPASKASADGMSKMRKLLQDERFQLHKLMTQEKTRAFDDEIDLAVRPGQTVQLVAWIRFHSVYQSGKMHIRFLSRRSGPVILVSHLKFSCYVTKL